MLSALPAQSASLSASALYQRAFAEIYRRFSASHQNVPTSSRASNTTRVQAGTGWRLTE
ncbi:hypothetical protein AtDm6_0934 [Acetobacter tropicalis]|uniref:Uncharacterized protein n=1 Tax=Acetobacter tropicalis TaxID=104102 RepID=A0A095B934_9PROT|nr:hypothetical protein AtDm6_0934 [Acetobacter tropicalis]GEL51502.1 hypothetical protein ATR01nite_25770 [Acetobacter tropicalis]